MGLSDELSYASRFSISSRSSLHGSASLVLKVPDRDHGIPKDDIDLSFLSLNIDLSGVPTRVMHLSYTVNR